MGQQQFTDSLLVTPMADGKYWKVVQDFRYTTDLGVSVAVPAGFLTDFASIPRILWNILPPYGRYTRAAVIHDWLYREHRKRHGHYSRSTADAVLLEAMRDCGCSALVTAIIWLGVRLGGWATWRKT